MSSIDSHPSPRMLRQFAVTTQFMLPLVTWMISGSLMATGIAAALGMVVLVASWFRPNVVRPLFVGLSLLTWPLGIVVSEVVLLVLYFAVLTPAGTISRVLGRDPLTLKKETSAGSGWMQRTQRSDPARYFRMS